MRALVLYSNGSSELWPLNLALIVMIKIQNYVTLLSDYMTLSNALVLIINVRFNSHNSFHSPPYMSSTLIQHICELPISANILHDKF